MVDNTQIEISTDLKEKLQKLATEKNTDIENAIKLALEENKQLKNPEVFLDTSKVSSKANKDKKGNIKSYSFSTAIPKSVLNKLGLTKGQLLYWDTDKNKIIITPEVQPTPAPEEASIQAGYEILNDMLINGNKIPYTNNVNFIKEILNLEKPKEEKVELLITRYNSDKTEKDGFKKVVIYLLDYPLNLPDQYEILQAVYDEITKD